MGMRPWYLITGNSSSEFHDMSKEEVENAWKSKSYKEKRKSVERVLRENRNIDWKRFVKEYEKRADETGIGHVLENFITPEDMTRFTSDLYDCRFGEGVKDRTLDVMSGTEGWISLYLPNGAAAYSKPGFIGGAVADSGIITTSKMPSWHMVISIFIKDAEETNKASVDLSMMSDCCYKQMLKESSK
jgi:hypothetical protein